jgi:transcriptional regulator
MYRPPAFSVEERDDLHDMIEASPFGSLVTSSDSGLEATGLPMIIDRGRGDLGTLRCQMARSNRQWQRIDGADALVIFQLVDGYISPSWYPSKAEHGKVVPTWNYDIVQVHETVRVHEEGKWIRQLVSDLTEHHESSVRGQSGRQPWKISDAPDDYIDRQLRAIVGVEIKVTRLEGKRKLSQNRSDDDRLGVVSGLVESQRNSDHSLAEAMRSTTDSDNKSHR